MRTILLSAVLLCIGCAPAPVTECGLSHDGAEWLTDEVLRRAELEVLQRMPLTAEPRLHDRTAMCHKLEGVVVTARPSGAWVEGEADGQTNCAQKRVWVEYPPQGVWQFGALAHELVHVLTDCDSHDYWTATGINAQLTNIYFTAVPDGVSP